ncbi:MAG: 30S ribosomal protein S13 [Vampirovibrionales bacterium]|nr:30S ribosomal protein S13 [Vampirovibrionales bacterium]
MARLVGVDLPRKKQVRFALPYIFGIGPNNAKTILAKANIDPTCRVENLSEQEVAKLKDLIEANYQVEGDLRRMEGLNIKRLIEINSYRGTRHRRGLPCRGQRSRTNARTRRGRRGGPMRKKA